MIIKNILNLEVLFLSCNLKLIKKNKYLKYKSDFPILPISSCLIESSTVDINTIKKKKVNKTKGVSFFILNILLWYKIRPSTAIKKTSKFIIKFPKKYEIGKMKNKTFIRLIIVDEYFLLFIIL